MPLPGWKQTNQRAELYAVLLVLQSCTNYVEIRSDSEYAINGCTRHRHRWRRLNWKGLDNVDLWQQVDALLTARGDITVKFTKVKGHAKIADVIRGAVKQQDRFGNNFADHLATQGAAQHCIAPDIVRAARCRSFIAKSVQQMMLDIVQERNAQAPGKEESQDDS
eukprot:2954104-Karenia_brevis.AAC.1